MTITLQDVASVVSALTVEHAKEIVRLQDRLADAEAGLDAAHQTISAYQNAIPQSGVSYDVIPLYDYNRIMGCFLNVARFTEIQALRESLRDGRRIDAIKLLREETGCGLKEAKLIVDELVKVIG